MGIIDYYARQNKRKILENRISALERLIKYYGKEYPFYPIYIDELEKTQEKLKKLRRE